MYLGGHLYRVTTAKTRWSFMGYPWPWPFRYIHNPPPVDKKSKQPGTPPSPSPAQRHRPPGCTSRYAKSRSSRTSRTSTGGPCLGARGKQAQLAQANGSKFNLLLMLVAQMSTYPRAIATHCCSWGSTKFKPTHGALTAFEDLGVVAVAVPRRARRCFSARLRRPPTRHRNRGRLLLQNLRSFDQSGI